MKYFSYSELEPSFHSHPHQTEHGPLSHCVLLWHEALIIHLCPEILGSQQKLVVLSASFKLLKALVEKKKRIKNRATMLSCK